MTAAARAVRTERATSTQEAILKAAERLYAEHGVFAVSNRQVSEAAGQGNNAAVGYHFGTKTDLVQVVDGITRCLPELPPAVVTERNIMARNLMMHTCADFERAYAEGAEVPRTSWSAVGSGLIDAIVGLWRGPP